MFSHKDWILLEKNIIKYQSIASFLTPSILHFKFILNILLFNLTKKSFSYSCETEVFGAIFKKNKYIY